MKTGNTKKNLPKLPYGQGSFSVEKRKGKEYIRFKKKTGTRTISVYGKTPKECMEKMKIKEEKEEKEYTLKSMAGPGIKGNVTLYESMSWWLKTFKYGHVKPKTYDTLESTLECQIKETIPGRMKTDEVGPSDIQKTVDKVMAEKSFSTTRKTYLLFNQFFSYYYKFCPGNNPMFNVSPPKRQTGFILTPDGMVEKDEGPSVLSDTEIKLLMEELDKPPRNGNTGYRHGNGILFILWIFCRTGEALALQWKDVDFKEKTVDIYKEFVKVQKRDEDGKKTGEKEWVLLPPKSKAGVRKIPMCNMAFECLLKYKDIQDREGRTGNSDFIFKTTYGNPLSSQFLNGILLKALKRAGIQTRITMHGLRHTGISFFIRHGVSDKVVSELAGHSDTGITNRIYYNVIEEQKKDAINNINSVKF